MHVYQCMHTTPTVQKIMAYESSQAQDYEYEVFARTKISAITVLVWSVQCVMETSFKSNTLSGYWRKTNWPDVNEHLSLHPKWCVLWNGSLLRIKFIARRPGGRRDLRWRQSSEALRSPGSASPSHWFQSRLGLRRSHHTWTSSACTTRKKWALERSLWSMKIYALTGQPS